MYDLSVLNDTLSSGLLIRTKIGESKNWITNIIEYVNGSTLRVPLLNEYFFENLLIHNSITIEFEDSKNQYSITGRIANIDISESQTMTIKITEFTRNKNRRKDIRYFTSYGASIQADGTAGLTCIVTNVSSSGICFVTNHPFEMSDLVKLDILLTDGNILTFTGKIVRINLQDYLFEYAVALEDSVLIKRNIMKIISDIETNNNILRDTLFKRFNIYLKNKTKSFFALKILVLEKSNLLRLIFKNELQNIGISDVIGTDSVNGLITLVKKNKPDIVCLPYMYYVSEGSGIFDKIYENSPDTKILMMTSNTEDIFRKDVLKKYGIEVIQRSYGNEKLISYIKNLT